MDLQAGCRPKAAVATVLDWQPTFCCSSDSSSPLAMRVVVAHNLYRSQQPSGENSVVREEIELLRARGCDVVELLPASDDLNGGLGLISAAGLSSGLRRPRTFEEVLAVSRPHVVHIHNAFPGIGARAVETA